MSTNGLSDWAVDLADIGAIYPFQGTEIFLYAIGIVLWIGWHIVQIRAENCEVRKEMNADASGEAARRAIETY